MVFGCNLLVFVVTTHMAAKHFAVFAMLPVRHFGKNAIVRHTVPMCAFIVRCAEVKPIGILAHCQPKYKPHLTIQKYYHLRLLCIRLDWITGYSGQSSSQQPLTSGHQGNTYRKIVQEEEKEYTVCNVDRSAITVNLLTVKSVCWKQEKLVQKWSTEGQTVHRCQGHGHTRMRHRCMWWTKVNIQCWVLLPRPSPPWINNPVLFVLLTFKEIVFLTALDSVSRFPSLLYADSSSGEKWLTFWSAL